MHHCLHCIIMHVLYAHVFACVYLSGRSAFPLSNHGRILSLVLPRVSATSIHIYHV
jgi:hypothetical protein